MWASKSFSAKLLAVAAAVVGPAGSARSCGCGPAFYGLLQSEVFDPRTGAWSEGPETRFGHQEHAMVQLDGDEVMVVGGWHPTCGELCDDEYHVAERLSLRGEVSADVPPLPEPLLVHLAVRVGSQVRVFARGGSDWTFDLATETWEASEPVAPAGATITRLSDGRLLVVDREDEGSQPAWIHDPATGERIEAGALAVPRAGHTATLLADGRVLVAGGERRSVPSELLSSTEIFDPPAASWSLGPPLRYPRRYHAAVRLRDGSVLVCGGEDGRLDDRHRRAAIPDAEIFEPGADRWIEVAPMAHGRRGHLATLLPDGRVLVTGGWRKYWEPVAAAELYIPSRRRFTGAGSMRTPRFSHADLVLKDGRVLFVGGRDSGPSYFP